MGRIFNFAAGPSMLPEEVLKKAAGELLDYRGTGMSVMEMSHRSKVYEGIIASAEARLRKVMGICDSYKVLFLQGGASQQFAMVPMNLLSKDETADYINTGSFAKNAIKEAKIIRKVNVIASSEEAGYTFIPEGYRITDGARYLHITTNNTIEGTKFPDIPEVGIPLVADMSSNILSERTDVDKFGLIYAGAQKNLGPAGVTIVIIRGDLIRDDITEYPAIFRYRTHADGASLFNTPPTYSIYMVDLVLEWLEDIGGIAEIEKRNLKKAKMLYDCLDDSKVFIAGARKKDRSIMNITFKTGNDELDGKFVKGAEAIGMTALKGHRSVGGMRASIYNAMPEAGVEKLIDYMKTFEKNI
jgi:phosphoserine aminotransferase